MVRSGDEPREKWLLMLDLSRTANGAIREPANTHVQQSVPDLIQRVWENEWALAFSACEYPYKYDFTYKDRKRRKARASACLCMRVHFCMCELTFTSLQPLIIA